MSKLPSILTIVSVCGAIATPILAVMGHKKAVKTLEAGGYDQNYIDSMYSKEHLKNTVKECWQAFVPAAAATVATAGAAIGSNCASIQTQAAMAGAIATLGTQHKKLDAAARRYLGDEKYRELRSKVTEFSNKPIPKPVPDKELYYEPITDQYFHATENDVLKAECALNRMFQSCKQYVSMAEYLSFFNTDELKITAADNEYGWYMDDTFDFNASFTKGDGYYIALECDPIDKKDGGHAIAIHTSIPPAEPSDEWNYDEYQWNYSEMKELNREEEVAA